MPKNLKKIADLDSKTGNDNQDIKIGDWVEHNRFGKGQIIDLEGKGSNKKALIRFENGGEKRLLLKFAKLKNLK